jgi:hypothetical protein
MLMQAAQALLQAATALSGGGKGGGLLSMGLGLLGGALLGGKGGGFLSGLFGKNPVSGIGAAGSVNDLLGSSGSQGVDDIFGIGFSSGGFTGDGPASAVKGVVHAGEWVWDREKTKRYWPLIQMIGLGRMPSFQGPGLGQTLGRGADGGRPLHLSFGDVHLHGVSDDRTARQTANQFIGRVQRGVAQVSRRGLNK